MSDPSALIQSVVFRLDGQRYAMSLAAVERVVPAVEITALPNAPTNVLGVIDLAGQVVPVFNLRRRFRLSERTVRPADQLVIARTSRQTVALVVDEVQTVLDVPALAIADPGEITRGAEPIVGVIKCFDGLVLIYDLEKFLSLGESAALAEALERKEAREA
jgi:purine-binding chemotaxis protein CheW